MNKETKTVETEVKETVVNTEEKENFFKKSWNKTKNFVKDHKGVVIGAAAGSIATIAGLLYLGKDGTTDFENAEAVEFAESPTDE